MARLAPEKKAALDAGTLATTNLAECLAIDQATLAPSALPGLGLEVALPHILAIHREVSSKGISHQIAAIGMAIGEAPLCLEKAAAAPVMERLRCHPSDTARSWAVFALTRANNTLSLRDQRPFVRLLRTPTLACASWRGWRCAPTSLPISFLLWRCCRAGLDSIDRSEYPPLRSRKHATARCVERTHCTAQS